MLTPAVLDGLVLGGIVLAAYLLDLAIGDPPWPLHPVRLLGRLVTRLESWFYRPGPPGFLSGLVLALSVPALTVAVYLAVRLPILLAPAPVSIVAGAILDAFVLYSCFAFRDLFDHVRPIAAGLEIGDLPVAQDAVQHIVSRDARRLDEPGVARAATESVAESLSDGAVGPITYFTMAALVAYGLGRPAADASVLATNAALVFRAVNTLDSMVGYRSERHLYFGRASARLDDVLGWLPARLTVVCLALAAFSLRLDATAGLKTWWRDRGLHPSPNAGQGESFVAGALGLRLGGPTIYAHGAGDKPWLGDGTAAATVVHLRQACRLVFRAGTLAVLAAIVFLASASLAPQLLGA